MCENVIVEVCCGSLDDALEAQRGGADRIELNCGLAQGGLTPSLGLLVKCKEMLNIPVIVMVRPRGGGFCYTENEAQTMYRDAELLLKHSADGIAFGFLNGDGSVDVRRCKGMLSIIGNRMSVFNRAIDIVPDPIKALECLIQLGVKRVLTSGQHPKAIDGAPIIRLLKEKAGEKIEILACGGIRADNIQTVLSLTGCNQVHFALPKEHIDSSVGANAAVKFSAPANLREEIFCITDGDGVSKIVKMAKQIKR